MRPDSNRWHSTNGATMTEFAPDVALVRRLRHVVFRLLGLNVIIAVALVAGAGFIARSNGWCDPNLAMVRTLATTHASRSPRSFQQFTDEICGVANQSVGFAAVVDSTGRPVAMTIKEDALWTAWQASQASKDSTVEITPFWTLGNAVYQIALGSQGYRLVVGMPDTLLMVTLGSVVVSMLVALLVVIIVFLPFSRRMFRRWCDGFAQLHRGMRGFGGGSDPKPLDVGAADEIGYLMAAFNSMAGQLVSRRLALIQANEELEHRVQVRTCELREAMIRLDEMASTDVLTELANRRALFTELNSIFKSVPVPNSDIHCIMFDLDGFKVVNDTLGHEMGDELLKIAAQTMRATCRNDDIAARLGGDEFVIILRLPDMDRAVDISNRIRRKFEEQVASLLQGEQVAVQPSLSCGVASRLRTKAKTPEELLLCADRAMYAAKRAGKRRTEVFGGLPGMPCDATSAST